MRPVLLPVLLLLATGPARTIAQTPCTDLLGNGSIAVPRRIAVLGGLPNPFNPTTRIQWALAAAGSAQVQVFDIAGRRIRDLFAGAALAGSNEVTWDGRSDDGAALPSGTYVVRATSAGATGSGRVTLVR